MKQKNNTFYYPHPIIKNVEEVKTLTDLNYNPSTNKPKLYDTFNFEAKNHISPKLLRISKSKVTVNDPFGILMQPFNRNQ